MATIKVFKIDTSKNSIRNFSCDGEFTIIVKDGEIIIQGGYCFIENTEKPTYVHECNMNKCLFIGWEWDSQNMRRVDIYLHQGEDPHDRYVIARFSSEAYDIMQSDMLCDRADNKESIFNNCLARVRKLDLI